MATVTTRHAAYEVVIIGGAIMGSSIAWFLTENADFDGRILIIEREMSYRECATALTNSCIRHQFSLPLNVRISQFTAEFIKTLCDRMRDVRAQNLAVQSYGHLYLGDTEAFASVLRTNQNIQWDAGAETELLTEDEIAARYPFYSLEGILLGSINRKDEGYWGGGTLLDRFHRSAGSRGIEYIQNEVVAINRKSRGLPRRKRHSDRRHGRCLRPGGERLGAARRTRRSDGRDQPTHRAAQKVYFITGFSDHGLQQSPAMGRGLAEMLTCGTCRTFDMSLSGYDRVVKDRPMLEKA